MRTDKLGIDQVEAFGAQPPHQQRNARQPDLGLRRGRHHRMVAVAHDDVADAHRDADAARPLDLGAADLDRVAVADIVLDRGRKPRRRHVEIDRPGAKPPPQAEERDREDHRQCRNDDRQPPDPALAGEPALQRRQPIADAVNAGRRSRQQPPRAMAGRLVMVAVPIGVVPVSGCAVGCLVGGLLTRCLGLTIASPRPRGAGARRWDCIAAAIRARPRVAGAPVRGIAANPWIGPVARHLARLLIQRADRRDIDFLVTIFRGRQTCPAAGPNPACRTGPAIALMIDPPKATKGRRMSKKSRKKSPKTASKARILRQNRRRPKRGPPKPARPARRSAKRARRQLPNLRTRPHRKG